jgi:hypothetical protein
MTTPKERAEFLELHPYKCYMCEGLIGMCTSTKLYIGAAIFDKSVTITCGYCGRRTFFKPATEVVGKNNGHTK